MPSRRRCLDLMAATLGGSRLGGAGPARAAAAPLVEVWKSPTCGCCGQWVAHLEQHGFRVRVHEVQGPAEHRERLGMPSAWGSCHTAVVQGYVIEGHVPAREIHRLLQEKPAALGLAVPGMPVGSPGMEMGDRRDPYDVLLVLRDGQARVYQRYR
jgi:hypothetical protein